MNKYRVSFLVILFTVLQYHAISQENRNSVSLELGNILYLGNTLNYPKKFTSTMLRGFEYRRDVFKGIFLSADFTYSYRNYEENPRIKTPYVVFTPFYFDTTLSDLGKVVHRRKYNLYELSAGYNYSIHAHNVSGSVGYCHATALNTILETIYFFPSGSTHSVSSTSETKEQYSGVLVALEYNYCFFKERLSAGINIKHRVFNKDFPPFSNFNLKLGFNF